MKKNAQQQDLLSGSARIDVSHSNDLRQVSLLDQPESMVGRVTSWIKSRTRMDLLFMVWATIVAVYFGSDSWAQMDIYEKGILVFLWIPLMVLCCKWRKLQYVALATALFALAGMGAYQGQIDRANHVFWLKYFLSSQQNIIWMGVLFLLSTIFYWVNTFREQKRFGWLANFFALAGFTMGVTALVMRWHESYLIAPDVGHIPVSNLYEVMVLFALMVVGFYLYFEEQYNTQQLGGFIMLVVLAVLGFILWYSVERGAQTIKPLVPALQSWWMKIHVPANFVGYGTFTIAAMVAFAYLVKYIGTDPQALPAFLKPNLSEKDMQQRGKFITFGLWILGALMFIEPLLFRPGMTVDYFSSYWAIYFGIGFVFVGAVIATRNRLARVLPDFEVMDDLMYKAVSIGFVFFTIATILGAFWAADAWGKYWSWDPKEIWALAVWLNYAAWLHYRMVKGMAGVLSAFWLLFGLLITCFAFLGVNMFLSGLHSYGKL